MELLGADHNSYSKTDPDATFMWLKEYHMKCRNQATPF